MSPLRIAVTGASGLIGTALVAHLRAQGHQVLRLVRRPAGAADEMTWDPAAGRVDLGRLAGVQAVVHLAGAGVGDHRWTTAYRAVILDSRVQGTGTIARAVAELDPAPAVLVSASAIGFYGDTGDRVVDETAPRGTGFLAEVVEAWEAAAEPARAAGVRVVHPRSGLVMARSGGAWARMLPLFRLGLGGRLGNGRQYWSYITLEDEVRALTHLLDSELAGPVNLTAPNPATNAEITKAMGVALHRPALLPVPAIALKTVLGEFSSEVLGSIRVRPTRLVADGFTYRHPDLVSAVATVS
ncbi:MAG TPA: TIGR01777 family oxidoreductase [Actinomycetes bacterium]